MTTNALKRPVCLVRGHKYVMPNQRYYQPLHGLHEYVEKGAVCMRCGKKVK